MTDGKKRARQPTSFGQRFGMLFALEPAGLVGKARQWTYLCDCGLLKNKTPTDVRKDITAGRVPNCGCRTAEFMGARLRTHGMTKHPAYAVWGSMIDRCSLPTHQAWANYGGRGITVCERWRGSFENFWADMGPTYRRGLQLDRNRNHEGYSPENCSWETPLVQSRNKRSNVFIETPAGRMTVSEAAQRAGINVTTLLYRMGKNWPPEKMFSPSRGYTTS